MEKKIYAYLIVKRVTQVFILFCFTTGLLRAFIPEGLVSFQEGPRQAIFGPGTFPLILALCEVYFGKCHIIIILCDFCTEMLE